MNPVSAVDLQLLDVIGYDLVPVPAVGQLFQAVGVATAGTTKAG